MNPPRNRKDETGNPPPTANASDFYPNQRAVPSGPWRFTDDAAMAISILEILEEFSEIHPEGLAENFCRCFIADPHRGYGHAMHSLLPELSDHPQHWRDLAPQLFKGRGSFGNGAAMRVAPIGTFFADDLNLVVKQAGLSAMITHSHPEGIAGAIAVALAAALAWRHKSSPLSAVDFLQQICERTPMSEVQLRISLALALLENATVDQAASALGSGAQVSAQDTVPFCLWAAALHLNHYEEAMWATVSGFRRSRHNLRHGRRNRCHVSRRGIDSICVDQGARTLAAVVSRLIR